MILALALLALCACSTTGEDGGKLVFGRNILFTRTASDEEAFGDALGRQVDEDELLLEDMAVPLASLPADVAAEEGWLLVRYIRTADGTVEPVWYRVWMMEDGSWSEENLPCDDADWQIPERPGAVG